MTTNLPTPGAGDPGRSQLEQTEAASVALNDLDSTDDSWTAEQERRSQRPPRWYEIIWSSGKARIGLVILAFFVILAVFAPLIAPYGPQDGSFAPLLSPSLTHPMGTTSQIGRAHV